VRHNQLFVRNTQVENGHGTISRLISDAIFERRAASAMETRLPSVGLRVHSIQDWPVAVKEVHTIHRKKFHSGAKWPEF
jgi:hypothetical protein